MAPEDLAGPATDADAAIDADTAPGAGGPGSGPQPDAVVPAGAVTRTVEVGAAPDDVWQAVADPAERALWLDDPDALARHVRVDESSPGHRLVWTWWRPGDEGDASTVSVVLSPVDGGDTRVVVTESLPATPRVLAFDRTSASASATASVGAARSVARVAASRRVPTFLRVGRDRWGSRLLGLELLFVAARVAVA